MKRSERAMKLAGLCLTAACLLCFIGLPAHAHKVNVFAYVEGDKVVVEGYFSGNAKARDTTVQVLDETGKKLLEGKTDKKGIFSFKLADLPQFTGGLKFVLDAEMGHKAEYVLAASELPAAGAREATASGQAPEQEAASQEKAAKQSHSKTQPVREPETSAAPSPPAAAAVSVVDQAVLTAALGAVLDKKLEPIVRMLGKQEKLLLEEKFGGPRVSDIVGGIGWIIGLAGIAAFFLSRNRSAKKGSDQG